MLKRVTLAGVLAFSVMMPSYAGVDEAVEAYDKGDYVAAFREFSRLAEAGDPTAQNNLAVMFAEGLGTIVNHKQAAQWYTVAAEQGMPTAQYNIGRLYEKGLGVDRDLKTAAVWYRLAAVQGDGEAQFHLGVLYAAGGDIERDDMEAYLWLTLAASRTSDIKIRKAALDTRKISIRRMSVKDIADAEMMAKRWRSGF